MNRICLEGNTDKTGGKSRKTCFRRKLLQAIHSTCRFHKAHEAFLIIGKLRNRCGAYRKPLRNTDAARAWLPTLALSAGMTVEASLVLPLFLFFMSEILYIFDMLRLQSSMLAALHETGTRISEYAFYARYGLSELAGGADSSGDESGDDGIWNVLASAALSETYVRSTVASYLGEGLLSASCLDGGAGGISYSQSSILAEDDLVDLVADYRIKPFLPMFGLKAFRTQARYYGHAWVGYTPKGEEASSDGSADAEETMVYITAAGTVYHTNRNCTYLKPSIRTISADDLDTARSRDGSRYYPCERCRPEGCHAVVIAKEGNRYHSSAACTAIQRDVVEISLSEAKSTKRACSKCGGS